MCFLSSPGVRSTVIRKMLMVLTVTSPGKAPNVASIRRHPEDVLCGIVSHSTQRLLNTTVLGLNLHIIDSHIHDAHIWTLERFISRKFITAFKIFLNRGPLAGSVHQILNTHVYSCWFLKHYFLLGRSTLWWPRSQSHFNVVISYASLVAKRWIPKSQGSNKVVYEWLEEINYIK